MKGQPGTLDVMVYNVAHPQTPVTQTWGDIIHTRIHCSVFALGLHTREEPGETEGQCNRMPHLMRECVVDLSKRGGGRKDEALRLTFLCLSHSKIIIH